MELLPVGLVDVKEMEIPVLVQVKERTRPVGLPDGHAGRIIIVAPLARFSAAGVGLYVGQRAD